MATTSDKRAKIRGNTAKTAYPVSSSTTLPGGTIAVLESAYAITGSDNSLGTGVGIVSTRVDNSDGANGAKKASIYDKCDVSLLFSGSPTAGNRAYVFDNETVAPSGSAAANGVFLGRFVEVDEDDSTRWWVRLSGPETTDGNEL